MVSYKIDKTLVQAMTSAQVDHYRVIPHQRREDDSLLLLCVEPPAEELSRELEIVLGVKVHFEAIDLGEFQRYKAENYLLNTQNERMKIKVHEDVFNEIISLAFQLKASDIHIEAQSSETRVRLRIDGALKTFFTLPSQDHQLLINKIKIKANLNISEKRRNQDGRITQVLSGTKVDIRVSTLPSLHGEKIVLRLLESEQQDLSIERVGMSESQLALYKRAYRKTNGIILISWPTGSGKTTTLYATLKELINEKFNVMTVEDPIEYTLDGINQVQVNKEIGLDFAASLKTFLRQDPDIIMVGEIRDEETAQMAVKASLTGHLVLSTIHTNSALGTIDRLKDMRVQDYLIANTLNLSVAQRLVRLLCKSCRLESTDRIEFPNESLQEITHFRSTGCEKCYFTGFQGRIALFEMLEIDREVSEMIKNDPGSIYNHLSKQGFKTIKDQARELIKSGKTSFEEAYPLLIE